MISDRQITQALHDLAGQDHPGPAPVADLLRRGQRRRTGRVTMFTSGAAVVTAVAIAISVMSGGTTAGVSAGPTHATATARPTDTVTDTAPVSLALAAQTTDATTYKVTLTMTPSNPPWVMIATVDPAHDAVSLIDQHGAKFQEQRKVGDRCFDQPEPGGAWRQTPGPCFANTTGLGFNNGTLLVDPGEVASQLQGGAGTTYVGRTGSGADAVDTWTFTETTTTATSFKVVRTGTVTVAVATNRIATIELQETRSWTDPDANPPAEKHIHQDMSLVFSDYGAPVTVVAPM